MKKTNYKTKADLAKKSWMKLRKKLKENPKSEKALEVSAAEV